MPDTAPQEICASGGARAGEAESSSIDKGIRVQMSICPESSFCHWFPKLCARSPEEIKLFLSHFSSQ